MVVKLLTEHHLEFQSLIGGCRGLSESKLVKMSNCWKSHAAAHPRYHEEETQNIDIHTTGSTQLKKSNQLTFS